MGIWPKVCKRTLLLFVARPIVLDHITFFHYIKHHFFCIIFLLVAKRFAIVTVMT